MADTARNNQRGGGDQRGGDNNRGGDNRRDSRGGEGGFDRKRSWGGDRDNRPGDWQERGAKQMKPGAIGMKVLVPASIVGAIIGKGGEEMKRIKTESGCYVRLSQNDKYFPNTQERPCYIEGEPEEIVKVLDFMQEKIRSDRPNRGNQIGIDQKRKEQLIIIIGPNAAGKCIGKGGENVKRLKSEYSVYVRCMAKEDVIPGLEERTVTISGEQENVSKAAKDIIELAVTCRNGGTDKNLDYDTYMGGAGGGAPAGQFGGPPQQGFNNNSMGNNQYGGNQGNYGGNNSYNQPQGGQGYNNGPPAQGGYNNNNSFNQPPQQFNNNAPPQAQPQGQFPPNQGIQQYNQQPQYNNAPAPGPAAGPGPVQQYGAPIQEVPPVVPSAAPLQQYSGAPVQQYNAPPANPAPAYIPPANAAPPAANIAVQQYPTQGGYQGPPNNAPGPNQGGYQGNNQGGGGYQGGNQGGYQGGNQGGYQGGNQGGYQGGNQGGGGGGGYQGNQGGGYQGNRGGYQGRGGNFGGGRGGGRGRGGRGK